MCDNCIDFLLSHFHKGYSPDESRRLWFATNPEVSFEHFHKVVESLTDAEKLLTVYTKWIKEQKMKPKSSSHDLIDKEDI